MTPTVLTGDCLAVMPTLDADSVDAIVCDPPYGLGFMGKAWDSFKAGDSAMRRTAERDAVNAGMSRQGGRQRACKDYQKRQARDMAAFQEWCEAWSVECLRVAKPGAHLVAFGGTRTFHRLTCAIEDAGWEVRDVLSWLYGSGFPKSHNGAWGGTALKPAWEPIILARKPLGGTVAANYIEHGTGALNIDGCRIASEPIHTTRTTALGVMNDDGWTPKPATFENHPSGRWPANVCLDEEAARLLDEASGTLTSNSGTPFRENGTPRNALGVFAGRNAPGYYGDSGGASRFFYTAKASRAERNAGLDGMPERKPHADEPNGRAWDIPGSHSTARANHHPTVKPLDLMQWLCRLVTPKGGLILDPFCGSGSTGRAAIAEGFRFIGIELSEEYATIARARIAEYAPLFGGAA